MLCFHPSGPGADLPSEFWGAFSDCLYLGLCNRGLKQRQRKQGWALVLSSSLSHRSRSLIWNPGARRAPESRTFRLQGVMQYVAHPYITPPARVAPCKQARSYFFSQPHECSGAEASMETDSGLTPIQVRLCC